MIESPCSVLIPRREPSEMGPASAPPCPNPENYIVHLAWASVINVENKTGE